MHSDVEDRIEDLEHRLQTYHDWLVDSIEQRDRLALDAAWGVHYALYLALAQILLFGGLWYVSDEIGWVGGIIFGLALFGSQLVVHMWSNGARMKEVERLAILPKWRGDTISR
jgi:hypothetical protein